jgi:hypothetical protein
MTNGVRQHDMMDAPLPAVTRWCAASHIDAKRAIRLLAEVLDRLVDYFKSEIEQYGLPAWQARKTQDLTPGTP